MSEANPSAIGEVVARNLRARRTDRGMTLAELAERSRISRRMITLVEKGEGNPSLATVERLARALGTSFAALIGAEQGGALKLVTPKQMVTPWKSKTGHGRVTITGQGSSAVELWDWRLGPGERYDAVADPTGAQELIFVVTGRLVLLLGRDRHELCQGHAVRFASDRTYTYLNDTERPIRFARVTIPPPLHG
ncbi:helix-turn-helix domain-containing protein [Actinomadura formosensis]|uniref:helix-turn-helix domain-containing protein n=1 Tax=Actinomadura formosensis TaxID=60706 RepID=UPI000A021A4C|nr:XRE family transcriptional regulator [Actinomadura formosensis]